MVSVTINGKVISAKDGSTILQAARSADIKIPVLCEFPAVEILGACRICLVEVQNSPKLAAACTTPATDGMVIFTHSQKVLETRKTILELIVARHPLDCFSCPSNGKCLLQDICYEMGVESSPYSNEKENIYKYEPDKSNPFIERDRNKCILCGRCVRICDSHARYHAVDYMGRGCETNVDPAPGESLDASDCVFCGQCVQVCPVGALADKPSLGAGRAWEIEHVKSVCPYCGVGCEILLNINKNTGKLANVTTDYFSKTSFNKGRACVKGRYAHGFVHSEERLTAPLIREGDVFRTASWDEALNLVSGKLQAAKDADGSASIGFFASARCTNEENYLMQRLAREVFGTNNVDHCAHL